MKSNTHVMEIPVNCTRNIKPDERPEGYMFVMSFNPDSLTPTYWGEVQLQNNGRSASFSYLVQEFDEEGMDYRLVLYCDRQLERPLIHAGVSYYADNQSLINIGDLRHAVIGKKRAETIVKAMHSIVCECLMERLPLVKAQKQGIMSDRAVIFGFDAGSIPRAIYNATDIPFLDLISIINRL